MELFSCTSKSPTLEGTSEPLNKGVNDVEFGCLYVYQDDHLCIIHFQIGQETQSS